MTARPPGQLREHDSFQLTCSSDASPEQVTWRYVAHESEYTQSTKLILIGIYPENKLTHGHRLKIYRNHISVI